MSKMHVAGFFSFMVAVTVIMCAYSMLALPKVHAFSESELSVPGQFTAQPAPPLPSVIAGDTPARPDISVMIYLGQIFEEYGGAIRILITNNDSRAVFMEEMRFEWAGTAMASSMTVNVRIEPSGTHEIKALEIDGPSSSGGNDYQLSMRLLQFRNNQWYRMTSGGDDWISFTPQVIDVQPLADQKDNPITPNARAYYSRVNDLVDFSSEAVANATENATAGLGPGYDMGKVCAIFDYLVENLNYTEDPGRDAWYSPDQTLESMAGDCEDYAMLLSAMVEHAGGTSRIYLTADHAFATVHVGDTKAELDGTISDVREYYRTQVPVHWFQDETGYWMVADPLGSFYMGGLAVGQAPVEQYQGSWNATFPESDGLYSIDVTGINMTPPLWMDPLLWAGMILVFGVLALAFLLSAQSQKQPRMMCHICAGEVAEGEQYICPTCKTVYHRPCAFSRGQCPTCQKPINYPPPPPLD